MSSLLVFDRVYRLEIQSVMLVFSTPLVNYNALLTFSLVHLTPTPPPPSSHPGVNKDWGMYSYSVSIVKKSRHLVFGVFIYILSMLHTKC
jgi:hypothetical protein